jgi:hypothetical protein
LVCSNNNRCNLEWECSSQATTTTTRKVNIRKTKKIRKRRRSAANLPVLHHQVPLEVEVGAAREKLIFHFFTLLFDLKI